MAIPSAQLEIWSNQGATVTSQATYASIQAALDAQSSTVRDKPKDVFLQGSYRNATNIYGDSDVDIVVRYENTWGRDLSLLPPPQVELYNRAYSNATYTWAQFRADILASLRAYYGAGAVTEGPKSLKLAAAPGRLAADIVPAITCKRFNYFLTDVLQSHVEGIRFHDRRDGSEIINYPKEHIKHGQEKNNAQRTNGNYKPTVRIFKNLRTRLIDNHVITRAVAPSYFVECLVYNAPDHVFVADRHEATRGVRQWLLDNPLPPLMCQNGIVPLCGASAVQWTIPNATQFIQAAVDLWNNW